MGGGGEGSREGRRVGGRGKWGGKGGGGRFYSTQMNFYWSLLTLIHSILA